MRDEAELGELRDRVRALQGRLAKVTRERDWLLDRLQELAEMLDLPLDDNLEKFDNVLRAVRALLAEAMAMLRAH
jgi:pilus assembly protein TadC